MPIQSSIVKIVLVVNYHRIFLGLEKTTLAQLKKQTAYKSPLPFPGWRQLPIIIYDYSGVRYINSLQASCKYGCMDMMVLEYRGIC